MENTVTLQQLNTIRSKMQEIMDKYRQIEDLRSHMWRDLPQLPLYSPSSALRDLPPPWEGHGLAVFFAMWLLFLDVMCKGLMGGLIFWLCTWGRVKSEKPLTRGVCMFFCVVTAPVIVVLVLNHLMEGGSWGMVCFLGAAAWFVGALLMIPAKVKANIQIKAENEARAEKNEKMEPYNGNLRELISYAEEGMEALQSQLAELIQRYGYPPDYATFHAIDYFIQCVRNHQADTYSRLIDLYKEDLHRQQMMEESRRQTQLLQEQAENQERIQNQLAYTNMLQFHQLLAQDETNERLAAIQRDMPRGV